MASFAKERGLHIIGDIPRSDTIIQYEDQGMTAIEGDINSESSQSVIALAKELLNEGS